MERGDERAGLPIVEAVTFADQGFDAGAAEAETGAEVFDVDFQGIGVTTTSSPQRAEKGASRVQSLPGFRTPKSKRSSYSFRLKTMGRPFNVTSRRDASTRMSPTWITVSISAYRHGIGGGRLPPGPEVPARRTIGSVR